MGTLATTQSTRLGLLIALGLTTLGACAPAKVEATLPHSIEISRRADESDDAWAKRWWAAKAARVLRGGQGLRSDEDVDALLAKPREAIVDELMADPRFGETLLDFDLYFLGTKPDRLRNSDGNLGEIAIQSAAAVRSAQETLRDGDFFQLVQLDPPLYMLPLPILVPATAEETGLSSEEIRAHRMALSQQFLEDELKKADTDPAFNLLQACADGQSDQRVFAFFGAGIGNNLMNATFASDWYGLFFNACAAVGAHPDFDVKAAFQTIHAKNEKLIAAIAPYAPALYTVERVDQIRTIDFPGLGLGPNPQFFTNMAQQLPNSSTNYNRKRAAYVLARFFCDDLTPIDIEDSGQHVGGRHASEASCQACHYKLDPMAGFFKDKGVNFVDFSHESEIQFDDAAKVDRAAYQEAWKADPASGREWEIGYIRSVSRPNLNSYGVGLDDLFRIARQAPELKRCVVRRLFEYVVSPAQTAEGTYLDDLVKEFDKVPVEHSGVAVKQIIRQLVLSQSFQQQDPVADQCYDFGAGHNPASAVPCKIVAVVQKNCVGCHDGSADPGQAVLDLSRWESPGPGLPESFYHVDEHGQRLSREQSLERILARLSATDPEQRMPLKKYMSSEDREKLYLWINDQLSQKLNNVRKTQ